jgi:hypothetical protein
MPQAPPLDPSSVESLPRHATLHPTLPLDQPSLFISLTRPLLRLQDFLKELRLVRSIFATMRCSRDSHADAGRDFSWTRGRTVHRTRGRHTIRFSSFSQGVMVQGRERNKGLGLAHRACNGPEMRKGEGRWEPEECGTIFAAGRPLPGLVLSRRIWFHARPHRVCFSPCSAAHPIFTPVLPARDVVPVLSFFFLVLARCRGKGGWLPKPPKRLHLRR